MRTYFLHDGQNQHGPYSIEEIVKQKLTRSTPVWYEGLNEWTTVENIPELVVLISTPPLFNTHTTASIPPPIKNYAPAKEAKRSDKSFILPLSIVGGVILIGVIFWLVYNNNTQAAAIEDIQSQQIQAQLDNVDTAQIDEQQKWVEEQRQKEEEAKRINEALTQRNMEYRNNWSNYINVTTNNYRYSELGGIYGLELTASNSTECMIDEVIVYVSYIKANGDTWKTIEVPIRNIPANTSRTVSVPDVERGTRVETTIKSIVSKKMHFYYEEGYSSGNPEDPYFNK